MAGRLVLDMIDERSGAAPATPSAGTYRYYTKNDGLRYQKDPSGVERAFLLSTVPETNKVLLDNLAEAWAMVEGTNRYMIFDTRDGVETITLGADPGTVAASQLLLRAGTRGWLATSTASMLLDAATTLELNSSGGKIFVGNDAVNQGIDYGTAGTRTLTFGSATATFVETGAAFTWNIKDNVANPWTVIEGANKYLEIITTNASEEIKYGNVGTNPKHTFLGSGAAVFGGALSCSGAFAPGSYAQVAGTFSYNVPGSAFTVNALSMALSVSDNLAGAWEVKEAANSYLKIDTTNGTEAVTIGQALKAVKGADVAGQLTTQMGVTAGATLNVGGLAYVNDAVSAEVANTNAETAFNKSKQFPANTFTPGRKLRVCAQGFAVDTNGGNQQLTIRVRLFVGAGPATITLCSFQQNFNDNDNWMVELDAHVLAAGSPNARTFAGFSRHGAGGGAVPLNGMRNVVANIDTTQPLTVEVSAQWQNLHVDNRAQLTFLEIEVA